MATKLDIVKDKVYGLLKEFTFNEIDEVFNYVNKKKEEDKKKEGLSKDFIKRIDRIFDLYPECNAIPLAYDYTDYSKVVTDNEFDELWNLCVDYIEENYESYVTPLPNDDMKIGVAKEIEKLWKECVLMNIVEPKTEDGDYCELCHYGIYYYDKDSGQVKYECDIND